ncbi:MAG TPA: hypothetical protein VKR31_16215 [Rhizomicrobium sp.]|nr:hypothetical protein [Rhizomicrobium sp.]
MRLSVLSFIVLVVLGESAIAQGASSPACLRSVDIDHTKTPNAHTILFFMKDGKIWSTTLRADCPDLIFNGFEYTPTPRDNICANLQTIRVLKSGAVCEIGPLVPIAP